MAPGGAFPDMNLAGVDGWNVADGREIQAPTPTPNKPMLDMPTVSGSPDWGGIDPSNAIPDLNLAGVDGMPAPDVVASPSMNPTVILPDFAVPDMAVPALASGDLTGPGITKRDEWAADPDVPDLSAYSHPYSLNIVGNDLMMVDPTSGDLLQVDQPNGLIVNHGPNSINLIDPLVPDLQSPDLAQQVHMRGRPGDLDPSALSVFNGEKDSDDIAGKSYPAMQMDARGNNSNRMRDMTQRMRGLQAEEK